MNSFNYLAHQTSRTTKLRPTQASADAEKRRKEEAHHHHQNIALAMIPVQLINLVEVPTYHNSEQVTN